MAAVPALDYRLDGPTILIGEELRGNPPGHSAGWASPNNLRSKATFAARRQGDVLDKNSQTMKQAYGCRWQQTEQESWRAHIRRTPDSQKLNRQRIWLFCEVYHSGRFDARRGLYHRYAQSHQRDWSSHH